MIQYYERLTLYARLHKLTWSYALGVLHECFIDQWSSNLRISNRFHSCLHQWDKLYFYQCRNLTEPLQLYCPCCFCTEQATWTLDMARNLTMLEPCLILKFFPHLTSSLGSREAIQLVYASKTALPLKTSKAFDHLASIPEVLLLFVVWSHQFTTDLPRTVRSPGVCNPFQPAEV